MDEFTEQPRRCSPTALGVLSALGTDTPLGIFALLQADTFTLSELARAMKTSKSVVHKYVAWLMPAGFLSDGNGRQLPQQRFLRHHLMKPLIAEATGMGFTYAPGRNLDFYVDYHTGERMAGTILPLARKSDGQLANLIIDSKNVVRVFHNLPYLSSFGQGHQVRIGGEKFSLEAVASTFKTNAARLEVRLAGREEPIVAVRDFSRYYTTKHEQGTSYPSTSR